MAISVVPAATAALKTLLEARSALAGVQVNDGMPWQPEAELIAILGADPNEQTSTGMMTGATSIRRESFTLSVMVSAIRKGDDDHGPVVARAYELAAEIENQLRSDITIGGALGDGGWAAISGLPLHKNGPDSDGQREAAIEVRIDCHASI